MIGWMNCWLRACVTTTLRPYFAGTRASGATLRELVTADVPDNQRILECVAALEAAQRPVDRRAFAGAWEVVWSDGTMAWRALVARAVQQVSGRSRAGQVFDLTAGSALNFAELFGGGTTITAQGKFAPAGGALAKRYPVAFDVQILQGALQTGGRQIALPIKGPGYFECLYGDAQVRVFRSKSGLAVQIPSDWEAC